MSYEDEDLDTIIWGFERLAEIRDKELYRNAYATFDEFCEDNLDSPLEKVKSALRLVDDPEILWVREAARIIMAERGLSFEAAVEQLGVASQQVRFQALLEIRDRKLYHKWCASFEAYVREVYCHGNEDYTQLVLKALQEFPPQEVAGQGIKA